MLEHVIYYMPASPMEMMCQTFGPYRKPQPLHGRGRTGPVVVVVVSLFSDFFLMSYSGLNFHFNYEGHGLGAAQDSNNVPCLDRNKSGTITERSDDCSSTSSKSRDKPRDKISSSSHLSPNCNGVSPHMDGGWSNSSCTLTEENLKIPIDREAHLEGGETGLLRARTSKYLNGGSWTVEIIAFALAIASLTCIVGVLAHYKGKAMPHWPAGITLNTVIAIMTAIANAALASPLQQGLSQLKWISFKRRSRPITDMEAFDDASRGLWGSIKLLVTGRGGVLGSFGASTVILALVMSPFTQQIVVYQTREAIATNKPHASINVALGYITVIPGDPSSPEPQFVPILPMKAAVLAGLFDDNPHPSPPFACPTGNCTWPVVSTLAVCSSCVSMTDFMERDCSSNKGNSSDCGWSLPNGARLNSSNSVFSMTPTIPSTNGDMSYSTIIKLNFMGTEAQNKATTSLLAGTGIVQPWAEQCTLQYCVQDIQTDVRNGLLEQNVLATYYNTSVMPINDTLKAGIDIPLLITSESKNETFHVGGSVMLGIQQWFKELFQAGSAMRNDISKTENNIVVNITIGDGVSEFTSFTSDVVQAFYWFYYAHPDGVKFISDRLAKTMTTAIRMCEGGVPVYGTAYELGTYVHIRWEWITLPAIVLLMTGIFLTAAIVRSRATKTMLWKSSALAMLLHGLDGDTRKRALTSDNLGQVNIRLDDGGGGGGGSRSQGRWSLRI